MGDMKDLVARSIKAARARAAAQEADRRKPEPIEITPEMIEAGARVLFDSIHCDLLQCMAESMAKDVFETMLAARREPKDPA